MSVVAVDCALPNTGTPVLQIVIVAGLLVAAGVGLLLVGRRRRHAKMAGFMVLALLAGSAMYGMSARPAWAGGPVDCSNGAAAAPPPASGGPTASAGPTASPVPTIGPGQITVRQTSVNTGIAPGTAPSLITGELKNISPVDVLITSVTVSISGVTKAAAAVDGPCSAADYVLTNTLMPVNVIIPNSGGTAPFSGALISFNNTSVNQDACQSATVHLHYTAV